MIMKLQDETVLVVLASNESSRYKSLIYSPLVGVHNLCSTDDINSTKQKSAQQTSVLVIPEILFETVNYLNFSRTNLLYYPGKIFATETSIYPN